MPASYVSNPRVTFDIVTRDQLVGLAANRALLFVQKTVAGSATAGLNTDLPRTAAEIDTLLGPTSMGAFIAKAFRRVNQYTPMDAVVLSDNGAGVAATASIAFSGTATADGSIYVTVASKSQHMFQVDIAVGDTAAAVATKLDAAVALGGSMPFTTGVATATVTFTAASKGTHANGWPLIVEGSVAGISATLTGWASGATDPSLTTVFDSLDTMRHQHIVWPSTWTRTGLKNFLNARKNVDNAVMEGRAITWDASDFATVKSNAATLNCSEIVLMTNEPNASAWWKGPHLPEAPDLLAANFCAARARRFESGISIADIVATNEPNDQFGGFDKASLPYFNTPLLEVELPAKGTGYSFTEQLELENNGVTVVGANREWTGVVMGQVVTTWKTDVAGNPDDTWKFLEWRDSHGVAREYIVVNVRKRFAQYRLTTGDTVANYAMANEAMIRSYILQLAVELMSSAIVVAGQKSRQYIQDHMTVVIKPSLREADVYVELPLVSQLGQVLGVVKFTFQAGS